MPHQHHRDFRTACIATLLMFLCGVAKVAIAGEHGGVIPDWVVLESALREPDPRSGGPAAFPQQALTDINNCPSVLGFSVTQDIAGLRFDSASMLTELYVGNPGGNCVVRHTVDSLLNHASSNLPVPYGVVWDAADLDCDGNFELVLQRGDGSNGFLDIVSSPSWNLRKRFTYFGMNVYMRARACNIDDDAYLELYLVPHSFSSGRAVLIDFDSGSGDFVEIANIEAPWPTQGEPAIGDFDNDGRVEFISGNYEGYGLFEWRDNQLTYIGNIGEPYGGYAAVACRPKPDGVLYALTGYVDDIGRYQLFRAVADNEFQLVHVFLRPTGWTGDHPVQAVDADCDGLDELAMTFPPGSELWEWDVAADSFVQSCVWGGRFASWNPVDLDQNGQLEWGNLNSDLFYDYPGPDCVGCDTTGHCTTPTFPCQCGCHGDPSCDGVIVDVLDVVATVDVAFRASPEEHDPAPLCVAMQTDVDCTGSTDVIDVVKMINVAFRNGNPATEFCDPCTAPVR